MLSVYVNIEYQSVAKMKTPYDIKFLAFIQIIYYREKIYYLKNNNAFTMMNVDKGDQIDWEKSCTCT